MVFKRHPPPIPVEPIQLSPKDCGTKVRLGTLHACAVFAEDRLAMAGMDLRSDSVAVGEVALSTAGPPGTVGIPYE